MRNFGEWEEGGGDGRGIDCRSRRIHEEYIWIENDRVASGSKQDPKFVSCTWPCFCTKNGAEFISRKATATIIAVSKSTEIT